MLKASEGKISALAGTQLVATMLGTDLRVLTGTEDLLGLTEHKLVPWQLPG